MNPRDRGQNGPAVEDISTPQAIEGAMTAHLSFETIQILKKVKTSCQIFFDNSVTLDVYMKEGVVKSIADCSSEETK